MAWNAAFDLHIGFFVDMGDWKGVHNTIWIFAVLLLYRNPGALLRLSFEAVTLDF